MPPCSGVGSGVNEYASSDKREVILCLIKVLEKKKISYYSCIKELNIDDYKLYFLNNKDYGNENDNSSVIYTELNNHKFLFMGDAGVEVEEDLLKNIKSIFNIIFKIHNLIFQ